MPMHAEMQRLGISPGQPPSGRQPLTPVEEGISKELSARLRTIPNNDLCLRTVTDYAKFETVLKCRPWPHELGPINMERLLDVAKRSVSDRAGLRFSIAEREGIIWIRATDKHKVRGRGKQGHQGPPDVSKPFFQAQAPVSQAKPPPPTDPYPGEAGPRGAAKDTPEVPPQDEPPPGRQGGPTQSGPLAATDPWHQPQPFGGGDPWSNQSLEATAAIRSHSEARRPAMTPPAEPMPHRPVPAPPALPKLPPMQLRMKSEAASPAPAQAPRLAPGSKKERLQAIAQRCTALSHQPQCEDNVSSDNLERLEDALEKLEAAPLLQRLDGSVAALGAGADSAETPLCRAPLTASISKASAEAGEGDIGCQPAAPPPPPQFTQPLVGAALPKAAPACLRSAAAVEKGLPPSPAPPPGVAAVRGPEAASGEACSECLWYDAVHPFSSEECQKFGLDYAAVIQGSTQLQKLSHADNDESWQFARLRGGGQDLREGWVPAYGFPNEALAEAPLGPADAEDNEEF